MLALNYVAQVLQEELHKDGRITFKVTDTFQNWYGYRVRDRDNNYYAPAVVRKLPIPVLNNNYETRVLMYEVNIKGVEQDRETIEEILKNLETFKVDGYEWKISNFIPESVSAAEDNNSKVSEFIGTFRLDVRVPNFITAQDIKVYIDDVLIERVGSGGIYDKGLIPNIPFSSDNISDIATGEDITLTIPLTNNPKVVELWQDVVSKNYNKTFEIKFDFVVLNTTVELVLVNGSFNERNNYETFRFNATFRRPLKREIIKINDYAIPVIGFTPNMATTPNPRQQGSSVYTRADNHTKTFNFQLINDESDVVNQIVKQIDKQTNEVFKIEWTFNSMTFITDCEVANGMISTSENANAIITVTMGETDNGYT